MILAISAAIGFAALGAAALKNTIERRNKRLVEARITERIHKRVGIPQKVSA